MTYWQKVIKYCAMAFAIFLTVSIISGILSLLGIFSFVSDLSDRKNVAGEIKTYDISDNITELDIDVSVADFYIETGDRFRVESNHKYLEVKEANGKMRVSEKKRVWGPFSGNVNITIFIPKNTLFNKADITTGAGRVYIEELAAEKLKLELGAGMATIDSITATESARVDGGAGELTINGGALNNLKLNIGVGKTKLVSQLTGKCNLDIGIGVTEVTLLGNREDYSFEVDKGVGGITIDGQKMSDNEVFGSGEHIIEVDGGVGSIEIKFSN